MLLPDDELVYAYTRALDGVSLLVVANFSDTTVPADVSERGAWAASELVLADYPVDAGADLELGPWECRVYRRTAAAHGRLTQQGPISQSPALIVADKAGKPFVLGGGAGLVLIDMATGAVAGSIAQRRVPSLLQPAVAVASRLAGRAQPANDQGHHDQSHDRVAPEPHDRAAGLGVVERIDPEAGQPSPSRSVRWRASG